MMRKGSAFANAGWLFFDVGNVLLIDEEYSLAMFRAILAGAERRVRPVDPAELMARRERLVLDAQDPAPWDALGAELVGEAHWPGLRTTVSERFASAWDEFNVPVPGHARVLERLSRGYRLAMASNQPAGARAGVNRLGLCEHFQVLGISEERGLAKPDEAFFSALVAEADVEPQRAIMIGDRIDNDIAPAQRLGFGTIHVQHAPAPWWFRQPSALSAVYLASLSRAPARGCGPANRGVQADLAVRSLDDLLRALICEDERAP